VPFSTGLLLRRRRFAAAAAALHRCALHAVAQRRRGKWRGAAVRAFCAVAHTQTAVPHVHDNAHLRACGPFRAPCRA
jgi:hypothetical protein